MKIGPSHQYLPLIAMPAETFSAAKGFDIEFVCQPFGCSTIVKRMQRTEVPFWSGPNDEHFSIRPGLE